MAKTDNLTDFLTGVADAIRTKKGTTAKINPQNFETEISSITGSKPEQEKTAALSMLNGDQVVSPDSGKVLSKVTITKPTTLIPENIRKSTEIGGVVGTLEEAKPEQEKTANATNSKQIISPNNGKTLSSVIIEAAPLPSIENPGYTNINGCLINVKENKLILGCNDSIIPSNVRITSIGDYAFYKCSDLTSITIPDGVTSIGSYAFSGCSGLTNVTMLSITPPTLGTTPFPSNVTTITVPVGCGNAYKTAEKWSAYADKIVEATA